MLAAISNSKINSLKHPISYPIFISPLYLRDEDATSNFLEKQEENFLPGEFFNEDRLISSSDICPNEFNENNAYLPDDWAKNLIISDDNKDLKRDYSRVMASMGLTNNEIDYVFHEGKLNVIKTVKSSKANEKYGREAATFAMFTGILGIVSAALENSQSFESDSSYLNYLNSVKTISRVAHGFTSGQRGRFQYGYIYSRDDDDKGIRIYQKEKYGNAISGNLANLSCTYETYLKPFALPVLGLISSQSIRESLSELLSLPTNLFWRSNYPSYIHQRFLTHLISYLANKPLSLLGHKASLTALEKLEEDTDMLSIFYVGKRVKSLLELKSGESVLGKITKLIKGLSSSDLCVADKSIRVLNEAMAPILGISGFFISAFGIPLQAISSLILGNESGEPVSFLRRGINSFSTLGTSTQQLLYTLRFSLRELIKSRQIKDFADSLTDAYDTQKRSELYKIANDRCLLSYTGLVSNILGIFTPLIHLMDISNPLLRATRTVFCETSYSLNQYFFSKRRELKGRHFRVDNAELFEKLDSLKKQNIDPLSQESFKLKVFKEE